MRERVEGYVYYVIGIHVLGRGGLSEWVGLVW